MTPQAPRDPRAALIDLGHRLNELLIVTEDAPADVDITDRGVPFVNPLLGMLAAVTVQLAPEGTDPKAFAAKVETELGTMYPFATAIDRVTAALA